MRLRTAEARVQVPTSVALYMLNHKREALERIEQRYGLHVVVAADDALIPPAYRLDRTRQIEGAPAGGRAATAPVRADITHTTARDGESEDDDHGMPAMPSHESYREDRGGRGRDDRGRGRGDRGREERGRDDRARGDEPREPREAQEGGEEGRGRGRRRRRRRGGRGGEDRGHGGSENQTPPVAGEAGGEVPGLATAPAGDGGPQPLIPHAEPGTIPQGEQAGEMQGERQHGPRGEGDEQGGRRRRRRGRRGGRRRHGEGGPQQEGAPQDGQPHQAAEPREEQHSRPPIIGPGHDLPDDEPTFRPAPAPRVDAPRIEGPGDAHDWPWNRRNERFPEETPVAAPLTPPSPFPATPDPLPRAESAPAGTQAPATAASEPPPADEPKGPPRKGWWKRLTS